MFLNVINYLINTIMITLALFIITLFVCILRTSLKKNKGPKVLSLNFEEDKSSTYGQKLYELIKIKTTSYNDNEGYHLFREKLKEEFPNIHIFFNKEKIDGNAIFTYKDYVDKAPNILFATHIDYKTLMQDTTRTIDEIYGSGTFDSKSLLYIMFEAVENILKEEKKLDVNLTMVMTTDDETTKQGVSHIVDQFLRKGKFFDLVIEEGSGIVDPSFFGLNSHFALVGMGVTGEAIIRFKTKKAFNGNRKLKEFIKEIKTNNIFKSKIDKLSKMTLKEILKDMSFKNRFFFSNQFLFKKTVKKLIDEKFIEVSKMLKTTVSNSDVLETVDDVYIDMTFELATHESTADVLLRLADYMIKYNIEYEILSIKAASKVTSLETKGYQIVKEVIESVYKDLYVVPTIITRISEKRYFDKVSDCVIRFSPLYYSMNAYRDALKGKEHISINSLSYGVSFFDKILKTYKRRL